MIDSIIRKIFIVMSFVVFSLFFVSTNARITQWGLDPLHNIHELGRLNPLHNHRSRINRESPGGPDPIHHHPISTLTDPLQNHRARIDRESPGGPDPIHHHQISTLTDTL